MAVRRRRACGGACAPFLIVAVLLAGCGCPVERAEEPGGTRLVSLAPNLTEIICAIGAEDCLVGRSSACDYPPGIGDRVPAVGGFGTPSIESVIAVRPSRVIEVDLGDETQGRQLEEMGIDRERIPCALVADIPKAIRRVGELTAKQEAARALAGELERGLALRRERVASVTHRPRVYVEVWHDPPMTGGRNSFLSELVQLAGGNNIGDATAEQFFRVSDEWVVSQDPEVVICAYMVKKANAAELVLQRPGWGDIAAVRDGAVYAGFNNDLLLRPGPRVLEGIDVVRQCLADSRGSGEGAR